MCFSPQRRAIFQYLNFKKLSEHVGFLAFSLENVILATAACNFSTSELQKVVWDPQFLTFWLGNFLLATAACNFWFLLWPNDSAPAALTSLLFDSPATRIIGKTQRFATSPTFGADASSFFWFSRYYIFFLLTLLHVLTLLSSDSTSSSDFNFFWLYFIYLLFICFSILHIVGSLLFKLPSTMQYGVNLCNTNHHKIFEPRGHFNPHNVTSLPATSHHKLISAHPIAPHHITTDNSSAHARTSHHITVHYVTSHNTTNRITSNAITSHPITSCN